VKIKDRIKEFKRVKASDLLPNPKNWRTHPEAQQNALKGVLAEVGIAGAVLARQLKDGSLMLVDGHLRVETLPDQMVPVLILDVNEEEADKLLATYDPISQLATSDAVKLDALLRTVNTGSDALQEMLASVAAEAGLYTEEWGGKEPVDLDSIDDYDPDNETVSIRLNNVPVSQKDGLIEALDKLAKPLGLKVEVF